MSNVFVPNAVPKNVQWWGIAREATAGTAVAPVLSVPLNNGLPDDIANMLLDKNLRGDMSEDYNMILGTEYSSFPLSGDVYLDSIGYLLHNLFGDYTATGSSGTSLGTTSEATTVGQTSIAGTYSSAAGAGVAVQIGTAPNTEVCVTAEGSSNTSLLLAGGGTRMAHASGAAVETVSAPFTHTFTVLNPGGTAVGWPANAQPVTHTITHYNGLAAAEKARQYAYWCASAIDFQMDSNNLFQHNTHGTAFLGVDATTAVTNTQSTVPAVPNWRFAVGLGGPASGSTLLNNIEQATVSPTRTLTNKFAMANQQDPVIIGRLGMEATGSLTWIAQDESPLLTELAGTQQELQIAMTNGLSGSSMLGITFNFALAQFSKVTLTDPDMMAYNITFRGLNNTTNAGASGGRVPMSVVLTNAVPTY